MLALRRLFLVLASCLLLSSCETEGTSSSEFLTFEYSEQWSYDETYHWRNCITPGYEFLTTIPEAHSFNPMTAECVICGYHFQNNDSIINVDDGSSYIGSTVLVFNKHYLDLYVGEFENLYVDSIPSASLSWSSSDSSVVVVANGSLKAVGVGTAVVKATDSNGCSASCNVTVYSSIYLETLNSKNISINVGSTENIVVSVKPNSAIYREVFWSVGNDQILDLESTMVPAQSMATITAKSVGTTTVIAYTGKSAITFNITVSGPDASKTYNLTLSNYSQFLSVSVTYADNGTVGTGLDKSDVIRYTVSVSLNNGLVMSEGGTIIVAIMTYIYIPNPAGGTSTNVRGSQVEIPLPKGKKSFYGTKDVVLGGTRPKVTFNGTYSVKFIDGQVKEQ